MKIIRYSLFKQIFPILIVVLVQSILFYVINYVLYPFYGKYVVQIYILSIIIACISTIVLSNINRINIAFYHWFAGIFVYSFLYDYFLYDPRIRYGPIIDLSGVFHGIVMIALLFSQLFTHFMIRGIKHIVKVNRVGELKTLPKLEKTELEDEQSSNVN